MSPQVDPPYRSAKRCEDYERRITALETTINGHDEYDGLKTETRVMDERLKRLERISWVVLAMVIFAVGESLIKLVIVPGAERGTAVQLNGLP